MNKKQLTKFISLVLALVLSVSAAVGVFASEATNDDYGTYEDGISSANVRGTRAYEKPAIETKQETNPFSFENGLMYWGPYSDSLDGTNYVKASEVASVMTDETTGEKYLQVGKENRTKTSAVYTVKVKLPDAASGKKLALFWQAKGGGTPKDMSSYRLYGTVELKGYSSTENTEVRFGNAINVKTDAWDAMSFKVDDEWNKETSKYDCVTVIIKNVYTTDEFDSRVYVKDIVVAYENADGSYTSIYDSSVVYNADTNLPYYGTYSDGISAKGISGKRGRVYELNAVDATKVNPYSLENGLMYWGATSVNTSTFTKASEFAGVEKIVETGETYLHVGKNNKEGGVYTVKVKLPDAANGKKIALFCQTKADGTPTTNNIYGSVELYKGCSTDKNDVSKLVDVTYNIKTTEWSVGDANMITSDVWNKESSDYDSISVKITNKENATVYVKDIVVAYENADGSYTSIFDSHILYNGVTKQPYYGTVKDGIACKQAKDSRIYELNAIDATKINPYSLENGLMYWGASSGLTSNAYTKASDVASVVKDATTGETYLQVGKKDVDNKSCTVRAVKVKLPDAARGKKLALFFQIKGEGESKPLNNGAAQQYGTVKFMSGNSQNTNDFSNVLDSTEQKIKWTSWNIGDGTMVTREAWDGISYDCVSVEIQNVYEDTYSTVVYIKDIVIAYANEDGSYTSIFDSSVTYDGTKLPYHGTTLGGISSAKVKGTRVYEKPAIDTTTANPFDFTHGLMYWGPTVSSLSNDTNVYTSASELSGIVTDPDTGETYLQVGKEGENNSAAGVYTVKVQLPEAAKGKKLALFFQSKGEGTPKDLGNSVCQYGTVKLMKGSSTDSTNDLANALGNGEQKIKWTDWDAGDGTMVTSDEWDGSSYDCVSVLIQNVYENACSTVVYIKDIVIAYDNEDGTYTSIYDSNLLYNGYTKHPYYGNTLYGMYTKNEANKKIGNMTIATDTLMNGDFSQGLRYWAPREGQYGYASQYATVTDSVLTLNTNAEYGGVTTCFVKIPNTALNKKVVGLFEYKTGEGYNSSASRVVKLITSATDATHEAVNDNAQFKLTSTTEYTQGSTKYVTFITEGSTVRLEVHNGYCPVSMKNFALAYIDEIGIPDKALYANLDGSIYGGFAMGDANADYAVDVCDLVRMVRYSDDKACGIYYTAIKLDNSDVNSIGNVEIDALLDRLLEME